MRSRDVPQPPRQTIALPLAGFPLFATTDVDEARDKVARVFCPHKLIPRYADPTLDVRHNRAELDDVSLNYIQYGTEIRIEPGTLGSFFLLQIPVAGSACIETAGLTVDASTDMGTLLSPSLDVKMVWSGACQKLLVQISRTSMEQALEGLLDRHVSRPIEFAPAFSFRKIQRRIACAVRFWQEDLDSNAGMFVHGIAGAQMRESLIKAVLKCHPHTHSEALDAGFPGIAPKNVRRAEDFMRHNVGQAITLRDIARAAGSSVRALQSGFREFRGMTPLETLRSFRMEAARAELLDATNGDSVTAIALRWGFQHLSRFSAAYKIRYGEFPSDTMRKRS